MGFAYYDMKDWNGARQSFLKAKELVDTTFVTNYWLTQTYNQMDSTDQAAEQYVYLLKLAGGNEKQYKNEILEARERALKLAQVKSRFLSNMSHEIRSPLTAIMGFTEIIDKIEVDTEKKNYLHAIKTSSEHLLSTVNDVLDFSKLDAGKLKLEKQPFYIASAIEEVAFALSSTSAANKGIKVDSIIELDKNLAVKGDLFRLKQILYNLLSNAIKFTEKGNVTIIANISGTTEKQVMVKIAVADTGIGIPNDQIKTVFEEFTQVTNNSTSKDTRRAIKGTGLGLSICKMLVELQGGTIGVESKLNQGSVFTFAIPYEVANDKVANEKELTAMNPISSSLKDKRVLVIEDNDVNIMLLTMLLKKVGIVYDIAKDGEIGLQLFKDNNFLFIGIVYYHYIYELNNLNLSY